MAEKPLKKSPLIGHPHQHAAIPAGTGSHGIVLRIELEKPPTALSPNARPHWCAKKKAKNQYKQHVLEATQVACHILGRERTKEAGFPWLTAVVGIQWRYRGIQPDGDNCVAALKAGVDGLTEAGVLIDDRHVLFMPPQMVKDTENPGVSLTIWRPLDHLCPYCGNTHLVEDPN